MTIQIKNRPHDDMDNTTVEIMWERRTTPVNLTKAVHVLQAISGHLARSMGNIGCGTTWLEVDGYCLQDDYTYTMDMDEATKTIARIADGSLARFDEQFRAEQEEEARRDI